MRSGLGETNVNLAFARLERYDPCYRHGRIEGGWEGGGGLVER